MVSRLARLASALARRIQGLAHRTFHGRQTAAPLHFLHIGKTGGTALQEAIGPVARQFNIQFHRHHVHLEHIPQGEKVFFFLRDPLARFASAFFSRKRQGRPRYDRPWLPGEAIAFARFETPNQLGAALSAPAAEERQAACAAADCPRALVVLGLVPRRGLSPQPRGRHPVYRAPGMPGRRFQCLKTILRLPGHLQLPRDEVLAHRTPDTWDKKLSAEAQRNLRKWYARDYDCLLLCRQLQEQNGDRASSGLVDRAGVGKRGMAWGLLTAR